LVRISWSIQRVQYGIAIARHTLPLYILWAVNILPSHQSPGSCLPTGKMQ
jgi:hypothetical protein